MIFDWTEESIETLKDLWAKGLSTSKIAEALGTTKNAVIGKSHRLELPPRGSPIKYADGSTFKAPKKQETKKEEKIEPIPEAFQWEYQNKRPEPVVDVYEHNLNAKKDKAEEDNPLDELILKDKCHCKKGKSLMELNYNDCRWPVGDPKDPDFHFCGEKAVEGKPYCPKHCAFAYIKAHG